ncbi:hypothetical protein BpHYR1_042430 [Brachionus plicatilis]|uniref:RNA-directed DNA polymerase from mobile element jockey-like n=1 Tax=Brachionus plicatilis TaxID=10195 RepID=A0A3M7QWD8_BRAPC|nr:hypothetical protein BpHYR1_042430 [Brachionus plicatilis]
MISIKFDESLCFNSQVEFIRSRIQDRLNIIKILSHKSWKLNGKTLVGSQKQISRGYKSNKIKARKTVYCLKEFKAVAGSKLFF